MKRHALDLVSLVSGLVFVTVAVGFLTGGLESLSVQFKLVWPLLLIGLGIALLAGSRRRTRD